MNKKTAVFWLKLAFVIGIVTDAAALLPMLFPPVASFFWGLSDFPGQYRFAMGMAAVFMAAWTLLLVWAYLKPLERMGVALLTLLVLIGFVIVEIISVANNTLTLSKAVPSFILQCLWIVLFAFSYLNARHQMRAKT